MKNFEFYLMTLSYILIEVFRKCLETFLNLEYYINSFFKKKKEL